MEILKFGTTSSFQLMYNDQGSGAKLDGAFYRPIPEPGYFILGDYGQSNYGPPRGTVITVTASDPDPERPLLRPPVDFVEIWNDRLSGADMDGSLWQPLPPNGYVALGCVSQNGYDKPDIPDYRCLQLDQVKAGMVSGLIWDDRDSGAQGDVSVYGIQITNVIYAQANYEPPLGPIFIPAGL